jgi:hypothetical protein
MRMPARQARSPIVFHEGLHERCQLVQVAEIKSFTDARKWAELEEVTSRRG